MIADAINAVKPVNTVFDGVSTYICVNTSDIHMTSYPRMRGYIKLR